MTASINQAHEDQIPTGARQRPRVLILGDRVSLAEALRRRLTVLGADASTFSGTDNELAIRLRQPDWTAVAVLTHDDPLALRLTLLSAHVRPDLPLWVTMFDRSIVNRFREIVPSINVVPGAEMVAAAISDHCEDLIRQRSGHISRGRGGVRVVDDALRLLLYAGAGLLITQVLQTATTMIAMHDGFINALYFSTRALATITDVPRSEIAPLWFKLFATAATMVSVALLAIFTAALVRRLGRPRLTTLFGRRQPAGAHHAILVGFGQIGFRLAIELQRRGLRVIALERDIDAPCVRLAARAGIPVAIGRGDDRATLESLGVNRCAVLAAVTSDDLTNVAIGLAATDVRADISLVMRLGDGNVADETASLLHLGRICDAHDLIAASIATSICG